MGVQSMELGEQELDKIGRYVQNHLPQWLSASFPYVFNQEKQFELNERIVRVEEGLKNVHIQMQQSFDLMEKRFEQVDKRFEQVDKRFEQVDKRFDQMQHTMDQRFKSLQWFLGIGFVVITTLMSLYNFIV